ncbi:hypothetical protein ANCDUO_06354 [Ancylostoma duodenale]|uniref:Uncharacterized protein n=1 Tax=Ancylostoma duodenale TaxID=51022 RepID=A0A0C2GWC9_9BILA|nr:hypothetical protein ANCDUO_06354 [Ancylostoma duodenale]
MLMDTVPSEDFHEHLTDLSARHGRPGLAPHLRPAAAGSAGRRPDGFHIGGSTCSDLFIKFFPGNMLPYMASYMRNYTDPSVRIEHFMWVPTFQGCFPFAMVIGGTLALHVGPRMATLIGCTIATVKAVGLT